MRVPGGAGRGIPDGAERVTDRLFLSADPRLGGVDPNLPLRPGVDGRSVVDFEVEGTGMDYHGTGAPVAALRKLAARTANGGPIDGEGVLVGVVDGPMVDHNWLDGGYLASPGEFDSFQPDGTQFPVEAVPPFTGHATFVSGLILQQAPGAGVWIERALQTDGAAPLAGVARAAHTLVKRGVAVLNLSLGTYEDDPVLRRTMQALVEELFEENAELVIVAAAGNRDPNQAPREFWPAALDRVVAVGSVSADDPTEWAPWSNTGDWVDFAADGDGVRSTYLDRPVDIPGRGRVDFYGWANWSGTSFAAAIVSGAIAATMTKHATTASDAVQELKHTAQNGPVSLDGERVAVVRRVTDWDAVLDRKAEPTAREWGHRYGRPAQKWLPRKWKWLVRKWSTRK